jgi:outer membrane protein OmpA-like peptidoglycan-associated protein
MRLGTRAAWGLTVLLVLSGLGVSQVITDEAHNLGPAVNSPKSDYAPFVSPDGKSLYFASDREGGEGGTDVWVSHRGADGQWGQPENLGSPLNTPGNEGPDTVSADGRTLYLTACDRKDGLGMCDIYYSQLGDNGKWSKPKNLGPPVNTRWSEANASLSLDGKSLYFVSIRPQGLGGWDIYVSHLNLKGWGEPENLGRPVNTPGNEFIAFIHPNDQDLYFSSDGHGGYGGADIFFSQKTAAGWSEPLNLGPVINTAYNDMYFSVPGAGDLAYLSSNRSDTLGHEDLYQVPMPLVLNQLKIAALARPIKPATTAPTTAPPTTLAEKPIAEAAPVAPTRPITQETITQAAVTQEALVLKNVLFDFDKATLRPESKTELNHLLDLLRQNLDLAIEILGNTDSIGPEDYNLDLSIRRALAVYKYLLQEGIEPRRLSCAGLGKTQPIASNDTAEGRQQNRRVEFKVFKR